MAKQKKWKIKGVKNNKDLAGFAVIVLSQRLNSLLSSIQIFFQDETVENLHEVRISLRRLRYNMEIFDICFDKKKFLSFYKNISVLQDLTGSKRDLDVLEQNINLITPDNKIPIYDVASIKINEKKKEINQKLKLELLKFIHSKSLKDFTKLLN